MSRGSGGRSGHSYGSRHSSSHRSRTYMTPERARAIQSHADKTGRNQDFKSRAMAAADRNEKEGKI